MNGQEQLTIRQALQLAGELSAVSDSPRLDAELLLCLVLQCQRSHLFTWPEKKLSDSEQTRYKNALARRKQGEPIAYITGRRAFWTFELQVNESVLIPRPETELLVELALAMPDLPVQARVADLGTGSGAIALALASERPAWQVVASDQSEAALAVAQSNARTLSVDNVAFSAGSWCQALPAGGFDMLVSNPPYIAPGDDHLEQGDLRFEPQSALMAADAGLADIITIATQAVSCLKPGGWLLFEHGFEQGEQVRELLSKLGFTAVDTHQDLAGLDRVTLGQLPR